MSSGMEEGLGRESPFEQGSLFQRWALFCVSTDMDLRVSAEVAMNGRGDGGNGLPKMRPLQGRYLIITSIVCFRASSVASNDFFSAGRLHFLGFCKHAVFTV